jgi:formamidopyrimidine-DNA glycosylase
MPELPEVQTVVSELQRKIKGKKIKSVAIDAERVAKPSAAVLRAKLPGTTVKGVTRRAKLIVIDLGGDHNLLIHLKMTGQLVYVAKSGKRTSGGHPIGDVGVLPNKFSHVIINFTDGSVLYFNDIRKFGWARYAGNAERDLEKEKYGVEPFDKKYTLDYFKKLLQKYPKRKIKQFLLDQTLVAGVGNIYADESLFMARIRPTRLVGSLKEKEIKDLYLAIPKILKFAISKGGTSADNYVRTDGTKGQMVKYLKVYGRKGEKCKRCGGTIHKIRLVGRGTHYCPDCQK